MELPQFGCIFRFNYCVPVLNKRIQREDDVFSTRKIRGLGSEHPISMNFCQFLISYSVLLKRKNLKITA